VDDSNLQISVEGYKDIKGTLDSLGLALRPLFDAHSSHWEQGSLAEKEAVSFPESEAIATAYSQAFIAIVVAGDHLAAVNRVLTEPVMTFAPWTALRVILESSATALWLLTKGISAKERVARSMALRYQYLLDGRTFSREAPGRFTMQPDTMRMNLQQIEQQLRDIENTAKARNIKLAHDSKGQVTGIGNGVPSMVDLIRRTLGEVQMYRLLSALAHGRTWAQVPLGFRYVENIKIKALTQHLDPVMAASVIVNAIIWHNRAVWAYFDLAGWDLESLKSVLEQHFDQAHLVAETRFWRK
jgi:hypothetical protein